DPGRRADAPAPQCREIPARDAELVAHDEKPVHALRQRAEQFDAAPFGKGGKRAMRRAADKIDGAVAQRLIGAIDRKDQLGRDIESLALEEAEFGGRQGREIRIRDQIRYRELHHVPLPPLSLRGAQRRSDPFGTEPHRAGYCFASLAMTAIGRSSWLARPAYRSSIRKGTGRFGAGEETSGSRLSPRRQCRNPPDRPRPWFS